MVSADEIRQIFVALIGLTFLGFALWALISPRQLAQVLGQQWSNGNGGNEFHAIYIGVFLAQALLCLVALLNPDIAILTDLVIAFLLAQPLGRLFALFRGFRTQGLLTLLFSLEVLGGGLLVLFR